MFVKVLADLTCEWQGLPPVYRIYVNDELIAEREYKFEKPVYLTEMIQIEIPVSEVTFVELIPVGPQISDFKFSNYRIEYCDNHVRVLPEHDKRFSVKILKTVNPKKKQIGNR